MVTNKMLTNNERKWLELALSREFDGRMDIVRQINSSEIKREYTSSFLAIKFYPSKLEKPTKVIGRVPVEVRIFYQDEVPIQLFLHVVGGYVNELEIIRADSSEITEDFNIKGEKVEFIVR